MINTLEELRKSESLENLYKYYDESLGKNVEEIKTLFNGYGIEISDECAKQCFDFYKSVEAIKDEELSDVAGGYDVNPAVPAEVRICLVNAIKLLDNEKRYNTPIVLEAAKSASQHLKDLLAKTFNREEFKQGLKDILLYDIGILVFSNNALKFVSDHIQQAQRLLNH